MKFINFVSCKIFKSRHTLCSNINFYFFAFLIQEFFFNSFNVSFIVLIS